MSIIKSGDYPFEMHDRTKHRKQMKELVRVAPDIKCAWPPTLWYASLEFVSDFAGIHMHG